MRKRNQKTNKKHIINLSVLVALLAALWIGSYLIVEGTVRFVDPSLENAIRLELGIDPEFALDKSDLQQIETLEIRDLQIISLEGIQQLTNLRVLDARENNIEDLAPLRTLTNLQVLDLRENNINDLRPLENLTELVDLNLRENKLGDITPIGSLTNIRDLNIRDNQITNIAALANLSQLRDLNIRNNSISSIEPLADLPNLTRRLYLEGNPVTDYSPVDHYYGFINDKDF